MLTGLGHRAIRSRNNQNRTIHLCSTGDHVLNIVSMSRAVNVRIVTVVGLVLNVSGIDRDAALSLLRGLIDHVVSLVFRLAFHCQRLGDRRGQRGFAVVNVTDGADIYMRLVSFKMCLCHRKCSSLVILIFLS